MKCFKNLTAIAVAVVALASCQKTKVIPDTEAPNNAIASSQKDDEKGKRHVYMLSNQAAGNEVVDYRRGHDGTLSINGSYPSGGNGTGGGLGSQGSVVLSEDGKLLLAVNAGSNSISSFTVTDEGLYLRSTVNSGGIRPISITVDHEIVYVLNAGGTGNISGFKLGKNDELTAILNTTRPLSSANAGPAQISFVNEGKAVAITEKNNNRIITYTIGKEGIPGVMHTVNSANATPFGFDGGKKDNIFVSEAGGGVPGASSVSSYHIDNDGSISLLSGPVTAGQTAACWVAVTKDGKIAYATNAGSNTVSSFDVNKNNGDVSVNAAAAAATGTSPTDVALSEDSKYLYISNSASHTITVYEVGHHGELTNVQTLAGVPVGAVGLAAK